MMAGEVKIANNLSIMENRFDSLKNIITIAIMIAII